MTQLFPSNFHPVPLAAKDAVKMPQSFGEKLNKNNTEWKSDGFPKTGQYTSGQERLGHLAKTQVESFIVKNIKSVGKLYDMVIEQFAALKDKRMFFQGEWNVILPACWSAFYMSNMCRW